jgi:hypothetical protein
MEGHTSINGVVSVTSLDTGKIVDVDVLSKHWQLCSRDNEIKEHNGTKKYSGCSDVKEVEAVLRIFQRSEHLQNAHFAQCLADGIPKPFTKLKRVDLMVRVLR